jgi:ABC-type spermidine/putrescine transport system permease subunit I
MSRHANLQLGSLISGPMLWLLVVYIGSLVALLVTSLYLTDPFTSSIVHKVSFTNLHNLVSQALYRDVTLRTIRVAISVTLIDLVLALPVAFFMAKVARKWIRRALAVALVLPLWASYLVKAYAWRTILDPAGGVLKKAAGVSPGFGLTSAIIVLAYLWLPYMTLPIYAGLEKLPNSLLDASSDLGAGAARTFRSVVLPLLAPSIIAGAIFTFSLSLGDYIVVQVVGGKSQTIGNVIYRDFGASDLPAAAAFATVPVVIMAVLLVVVRRTGALDNL